MWYSHKPAVAISCIYLLKFICQTWPAPRQSTKMSTLCIVLILGAINARRSFNEEKLVKQQAILATKKVRFTRGDKESLIRRIKSLLLGNLMLGQKSNPQTKQ